MPRIAATLAVSVLIAGSMALNTVRYPIVWELSRPGLVPGCSLPRSGVPALARATPSTKARNAQPASAFRPPCSASEAGHTATLAGSPPIAANHRQLRPQVPAASSPSKPIPILAAEPIARVAEPASQPIPPKPAKPARPTASQKRQSSAKGDARPASAAATVQSTPEAAAKSLPAEQAVAKSVPAERDVAKAAPEPEKFSSETRLVPVVRSDAPDGQAHSAEGGLPEAPGLERLPPVSDVASAPAALPPGVIPFYPSTGVN